MYFLTSEKDVCAVIQRPQQLQVWAPHLIPLLSVSEKAETLITQSHYPNSCHLQGKTHTCALHGGCLRDKGNSKEGEGSLYARVPTAQRSII